MCGIAGFIERRGDTGRESLSAVASAMARTLHHRGPDDIGTWVDEEAGIAFGHARLSILDLSAAGHQPMVSASGRYVISYNGEVYNFLDLRKELAEAGVSLRGRCDTEVVIEACARWGVRNAVSRMVGMFAFALWDREERTLVLVRDRLGIKPLYWAELGALCLFGSELKALRAHPGWEPEVDRAALSSYMRFAYVPAPHCIYRSVHKLEPGEMVTIGPGGALARERFWDFRRIATNAQKDRRSPSDGEAAEHLDSLLRSAVGYRMLADVPIGAFLSGGIDSSTVVSIMQALSDRPIRTFTIGFDEAEFNEANHAREIAQHLGTDHTELYARPRDALDVIPSLPQLFDEPFADSSQVPTYMLSALTRQHVTVALSGDGGDELFAGYNRYAWSERIVRRFSWIPAPLRGLAGTVMESVPAPIWRHGIRMLPRHRRPGDPVSAARKLAKMLRSRDTDNIYRHMLTHWADPDTIVLGADEQKGILWDTSVADEFPDFVERMQFFDTVGYLPDDILTKVDRASMGVSLEARVPLLDHRVVEHVWGLRPHMKTRAGQTKWLLRQVLYQYVPPELIERPKKGFGVPIHLWLRGELRDWAEALLDEGRLASEGYFDPRPIREKWEQYLGGHGSWHYLLWAVLMFQAWLEATTSSDSRAPVAHAFTRGPR